MFKNEEILEFLTKIVTNSNSQSVDASKECIEKFSEYIKLTTMCDENILKGISKVSACLEELILIYEKTGTCDLRPILHMDNEKKEKSPVLRKKRVFSHPYQKKHYDRYIPTSDFHSSSCGSSRSSSASSCGSTDYSYGSSCGSGSSYGSRC